MIKKRILGTLGALSAVVAACSGGTVDNGPGAGNAAGATSVTGNGGSVGSNGGAGPTPGAGNSSVPGGGNAPTAGAGNTAGNGSGNSPGAGGSTAGPPPDRNTCVPGIPGTSQVPRMKNTAYDAVVRDLLGVTTVASGGNKKPSELLVDDSNGSLTDISWNAYLTTAEKIAAEVMAGANKSKFISCDPATEACLKDTIKTFGRKAFRRPVTDAEVTSFLRLNALSPKGTPAEVAEAILYAFLASPSFIALPELAQEKEGAAIKLNSFEVASRLSFLLWNSVPDDMLNAAADAGMLTTKEQISAQAQRMLKSDKASAVAANFHRYYAAIQPASHWVNNTDHDATKYTSFKPAAYAPMMAEVDAFFSDIVLKGGTFKDLFLSNVAYVNKDTAPLYGLDASKYNTELTRVELDATQRPGFLTRVGFLSTFSGFDATSPILRGAFISGHVLGVDPGNPDPNALKLPIPPGTYSTRRQQIEALTANEPCKSCHAVTINPSGYVLERYNAVGTWQDKDPLGGAIDSTANVRFSATVTKTVSSPIEMMTEIANLPEAKKNYAEQFVAFASGRVPNGNDACTVQQLSTNLAQATYPISSLIADYTQADSFRLRTVGN